MFWWTNRLKMDLTTSGSAGYRKSGEGWGSEFSECGDPLILSNSIVRFSVVIACNMGEENLHESIFAK